MIKRLNLIFPKDEVKKPVLCLMAKNTNIEYSIVSASIYNGEGIMQISISGEDKDIQEAVEFLNDANITSTDIDDFMLDI